MGNNASNNSTLEALEQRITTTTKELAELSAQTERIKHIVAEFANETDLHQAKEESVSVDTHVTELRRKQSAAEGSMFEEINSLASALESALDKRKSLIEEYIRLREHAGLDLPVIELSDHILQTWGFEDRESAIASQQLQDIEAEIKQLKDELLLQRTQEATLQVQYMEMSLLSRDIEQLEQSTQSPEELTAHLQQLEHTYGIDARQATEWLNSALEMKRSCCDEIEQLRNQVTALEEIEVSARKLEEIEAATRDHNAACVTHLEQLKQRNAELAKQVDDLAVEQGTA